MILVTIALETAEDEARLIAFLPSVHGQVVDKTDDAPAPAGVTEDELASKRERLRNAMDRLAENRTAEKFGDASEWQRDVRSWDRILDGRGE